MQEAEKEQRSKPWELVEMPSCARHHHCDDELCRFGDLGRSELKEFELGLMRMKVELVITFLVLLLVCVCVIKDDKNTRALVLNF